jgi:hypothetical protein
MKYLYFPIVLILTGCISNNQPLEGDFFQNQDEDIFYVSGPMFIEINNIPPPFDVAGNFPYVLWINGQRVPYAPVKELTAVVSKIGKDKIKEIDYADIHKGWLYPHMSPPPHDEPKIRGRTRSVGIKHGD